MAQHATSEARLIFVWILVTVPSCDKTFEVPVSFNEDTSSVLWFDKKTAPTGLTILFNQRSELSAEQYVSLRGECRQHFTEETWASIRNDLASFHNRISRIDQSFSPPAGAAARWVHTPERVPYFRASFYQTKSSEDLGLGASYKGASAEIKASQESTSINLALASVFYKVSLTDAAVACIEDRLCSQAGGGMYASSVYYGALVLLGIEDASYRFGGELRAGPKVVEGKAEFKLSRDNLTLDAAVFGGFAGLDELSEKSGLSTESIVESLRDKRLLDAGSRIRSAVKDLAIIGLIPTTVTSTRCTSQKGAQR